MMITGRVRKEEGVWWSAEAPVAGIYTQGTSAKDAMAMLADAFEALVDRPGFKVAVTEHGPGGEVLVDSSEPAALIAYVLKYQRETHGMSLGGVATALGESSRTTYARYERGDVVPTVQKLVDALRAVAPELAVVIVERNPSAATGASEARASEPYGMPPTVKHRATEAGRKSSTGKYSVRSASARARTKRKS